jgi:exodeoxyribonuclease VII small subunit
MSATPTFEDSLEKLQLAVKRLESGELSLEQALECFEEGVKLSKSCNEQLTAAEQRVELLVKASVDADGQAKVETQPFSPTRT